MHIVICHNELDVGVNILDGAPSEIPDQSFRSGFNCDIFLHCSAHAGCYSKKLFFKDMR
jgi:hypothetical protein